MIDTRKIAPQQFVMVCLCEKDAGCLQALITKMDPKIIAVILMEHMGVKVNKKGFGTLIVHPDMWVHDKINYPAPAGEASRQAGHDLREFLIKLGTFSEKETDKIIKTGRVITIPDAGCSFFCFSYLRKK